MENFYTSHQVGGYVIPNLQEKWRERSWPKGLVNTSTSQDEARL